MSGIVRRLVVRDLYLMRWVVLASLVSGAAAVAILPIGGASAYVGGVSLICVLVILNIFLVMTGIVQEKKDKVLLFTLSLPLSPAQYTIARRGSCGRLYRLACGRDHHRQRLGQFSDSVRAFAALSVAARRRAGCGVDSRCRRDCRDRICGWRRRAGDGPLCTVAHARFRLT